MSPGNHLHGRKYGKFKGVAEGQGCRACGVERFSEGIRMSFAEWRRRCEEIHDQLYDYSGVEWKGRLEKVEILCKQHGSFVQRASDHLAGHACPKCNQSSSIKEKKWLDSLGVSEVFRQVRLEIGGTSFVVDGYDPNNETIYEFWGDFFHGNPKVHKKRDKITFIGKTFAQLFRKTQQKRRFIQNAGYNLIEIWENEWDSRQNKDV